MSSNYNGVDFFLASLALMTDGDSPSAALFRAPLERLLDNDVHLQARAAVLEVEWWRVHREHQHAGDSPDALIAERALLSVAARARRLGL